LNIEGLRTSIAFVASDIPHGRASLRFHSIDRPSRIAALTSR
jgi:hypothetical protein